MRYEPGWGARLDPAEIDRLLAENAGVEVVFATLSETSTGIVHDVQAIAEVVNRHGAILAVDAVSGLGAAELRQDEWGIDVVVAGSQKALMCPPGLGFASVSQRALDYVAGDGRAAATTSTGPGRRRASARATARSRRPSALFLGLDVALDMIEEEGLDNVFARHALLARATRAGVAGLGLELFGDPDERSNVVTAIELPDGRSTARKVPGALRKLGITANGGQNQLKGKILRIAHCGYFGAFDILTSLAGLEMALAAARPRRRARRRRRRRPARVPRGGRARRRVGLLLHEPYRILVKEKIADSGVDAPARAASTSTSASTGPTTSSPSASATTTGS